MELASDIKHHACHPSSVLQRVVSTVLGNVDYLWNGYIQKKTGSSVLALFA